MISPEKIWSSDQLPTLPAVAVKLLDLSKNPDTDIKEVIDTIKADPAITAKILKASNSSFFGLRSECKGIERAVPLLGTMVVTSLALSFSLSESAITQGPLKSRFDSYWKQSIIQSAAAELLAAKSGNDLKYDSFLLGLLQDIGHLAMLRSIPTDLLSVLEQAETEQRESVEVESAELGINHAEVGVKMMERWQLSEQFQTAIQHHHDSVAQLKTLESHPDFNLITIIATSAAIGDYFCSVNSGLALQKLQDLTSEFYNMPHDDLHGFLEQVQVRFEEAAQIFAVNMDDIESPFEIMAKANEQLVQMTMKAQVDTTQAFARQAVIEEQKNKLESENKQLQSKAIHDPLTKTYNRSYFNENFEKELYSCSRDAQPIGIIFSDIDRFKNLNDTYGHQFGDLVLQRVAKVASESTRRSDVFCRYGGEEFVIMVNNPTENGIRDLAERLRKLIENEVIEFEGARVPVTASLGAVVGIPPRDLTGFAERLVAEADEAMYESKENGRNQVHVRSIVSKNEQELHKLIKRCRFSRWLVTKEVFDIPTISKALLKCSKQQKQSRIGELAIAEKMLSENDVSKILELQELKGLRFGEIAIQQNFLTQEQTAYLLALQIEPPIVLGKTLISLELLESTQAAELIKQYLAEMKPCSIAADAHRNQLANS
ncbi:sensor domain-containing diguanylate cyclase [Gimesia maris]|uniref:diguanylate cyclase n=1 Tax=Gimesia maris TaxID=122 RepID=A0ABX5YG13_9PLAN|nr:GGDEF domain-containing protein [Gimesia maris]EDL58611.1 GGDEF domain-like protein [Gimesia maris DSM 8797]QEG14548.1 Diguanylate cyclase DosC [Gimesia maris]QGQ32036.1 HDOD domain-containing protein [Gimesia maris]